MHITIVAVNQKLPAWAQTAIDDYLARFPRDFTVTVKEVKAETRSSGKPVAQVMAAEAERIERAVPAGDILVAMDEHGRDMTTVDFAKKISGWKNEGCGHTGSCQGKILPYLVRPFHELFDELPINVGKLSVGLSELPVGFGEPVYLPEQLLFHRTTVLLDRRYRHVDGSWKGRLGCLFLTDKLRSLIKIEPVPTQVGDGFEQSREQVEKVPLGSLV